MTTHKKDAMEEVTLAYIAGIVDGEGHIGMNIGANGSFAARVTVASSSKYLLDFLTSSLGMGTIYDHRNGMYQWYLSQGYHVKFLEMIFPYLKVKRRQARLLLIYYKQRPLYRHDRVRVSDEEIGRRYRIYHALKKLNARKTTPYIRLQRLNEKTPKGDATV